MGGATAWCESVCNDVAQRIRSMPCGTVHAAGHRVVDALWVLIRNATESLGEGIDVFRLYQDGRRRFLSAMECGDVFTQGSPGTRPWRKSIALMTSHCTARSSLPPAKSKNLRGMPAESAAATRSEIASAGRARRHGPSSRTAATPKRAVASSRAPPTRATPGGRDGPDPERQLECTTCARSSTRSSTPTARESQGSTCRSPAPSSACVASPADVPQQQLNCQVMAVVNGEVHGCLAVRSWQLRVSTEGQEHSSGMHSQRVAALQGAVTFRVNGVHQERHFAAKLIRVGSLGQQLSQNLCVLVLHRLMRRRPDVLHGGIQPLLPTFWPAPSRAPLTN